MASDNKKCCIDINGRIVAVSVDKIKPYKKDVIQANRDTRDTDAILERDICGEKFLVRLRSGIQNAYLRILQ